MAKSWLLRRGNFAVFAVFLAAATMASAGTTQERLESVADPQGEQHHPPREEQGEEPPTQYLVRIIQAQVDILQCVTGHSEHCTALAADVAALRSQVRREYPYVWWGGLCGVAAVWVRYVSRGMR